MEYIYSEPNRYGFKNVNGHHGKFFNAKSTQTNHLIIECDDKLTVSLIQHKSEFNYYIIDGSGYFIINDKKRSVTRGDLAVIPPNTKFSFGGKLKMLLINTPCYSPDQEEVIRE